LLHHLGTFIAISPNREDQKRGVVKLKDDPNQMGTQITLIARIALHLSYSDLTTPIKMVLVGKKLTP
jgi:hypothetical protein